MELGALECAVSKPRQLALSGRTEPQESLLNQEGGYLFTRKQETGWWKGKGQWAIEPYSAIVHNGARGRALGSW